MSDELTVRFTGDTIELDVRLVACPKCKARAGQECRGGRAHKQRRRAVVQFFDGLVAKRLGIKRRAPRLKGKR